MTDISQLLRDLNENVPYWGLIAAGSGLIIGYSVGRLHGAINAANSPHVETSYPNQIEEADEFDEDYKQRPIIDAMRPGTESTVSGVITEFHNSLRGYSGVVKDSSGQCPFHMGEDNFPSREDEGLAPVLMNDSMKNNTPIEMKVIFDGDTHVFMVEALKYYMNGHPYNIKYDF